MNQKNAESGRSVGLAAHTPGGIRASRFSSWLRRSRALTQEGGASLVETALAYAILIPLLVGTIEFGYMFYTYQNVADASRKAARWASVHGSGASTGCTSNAPDCNALTGTYSVTNYVEGLNYPGVSFSAGDVAVSYWCVDNGGSTATWVNTSGSTTCPSGTDDPGGAANAPGNEVQVTVTYSFPLKIAYWKATTISIPSTGSMVIDY